MIDNVIDFQHMAGSGCPAHPTGPGMNEVENGARAHGPPWRTEALVPLDRNASKQDATPLVCTLDC
jgi:hypothetical protein